VAVLLPLRLKIHGSANYEQTRHHSLEDDGDDIGLVPPAKTNDDNDLDRTDGRQGIGITQRLRYIATS
jgi:hypothetical protein